jgi:hypothetical protein
LTLAAEAASCSAMTAAVGELTCVNHSKTPTVLRCNKCDRPMCLRCLELTAVGHRCKECLGASRAGYYNATPADHVLAAVVGVVPSILAGAIAPYAYFYFALIGGPIGGGIVSEAIRWSIGRRRGRFIWLVASAAVVVGGLVGVGLWSLATARTPLAEEARITYLASALGSFAIYAALAVVTVYVRLRV